MHTCVHSNIVSADIMLLYILVLLTQLSGASVTGAACVCTQMYIHASVQGAAA